MLHYILLFELQICNGIDDVDDSTLAVNAGEMIPSRYDCTRDDEIPLIIKDLNPPYCSTNG